MVSLDGGTEFERTRNQLILPAVFTLTIFVSASLLFFVQPLFAKLVLPHIGGAPAVWTTAMLFFQVVLLAGYIYAHVLTKYVSLRWQLPIHLAFWAVSLSFLPLAIPDGWRYDPQGSATVQTLTLFTLGVGVPFGMLAANAPLLQFWYARSSGPSAQDPYFLYGSSNLGSLLALLAFPLLAEPLFGAQSIGIAWSFVFVGFGLCLAASGVMALRHPGHTVPRAKKKKTRARKIGVRHCAKWIFIAFVPSSLMLAITTKVSTDMGSLPLIWAVPLCIYIFSFVITFTNKPLFSDRILPGLTIATCAAMAVLMSSLSHGIPTWVIALLFVPMLFCVATFAHRKLYQSRPDSTHLTVFYICMSSGGALGGLFNSIFAPMIFNSIHEGWISVLYAASVALFGAGKLKSRQLAYGLLAAGGGLLVFSTLRDHAAEHTFYPTLFLISLTLFAAAFAMLWRSPLAVLTALGAFLAVDLASVQQDYLFKDRSFFGAHTVYDTDGLRVYANGTTVHGYQRVNNGNSRPVPLSYYHPNSPMAQILKSSDGVETAQVAIVGLGVGSLACYSTPGQSWEFYEIDRMVDETARNPDLFTFMSDCAPGSQTHLGDARIVLAQQDFTFDIMVMDAYSSDSIPAHLVTVEAVKMYRERLSDNGQMVFHISNRYYDLSQPLARIGRELGLESVIRYDRGEDITIPGAQPSVVMVLSPSEQRLNTLLEDTRWARVEADATPAWTDDRTNLLSALK